MSLHDHTYQENVKRTCYHLTYVRFFLLATSLLKDRSIYVYLIIPTQKLCIKSHHTNISHYFHAAAEEKDNEKKKNIILPLMICVTGFQITLLLGCSTVCSTFVIIMSFVFVVVERCFKKI